MNTKLVKKQKRANGLTGSIPTATPRGILASSLRGLAIALLCAAALLFAASALVYSLADPNRFVTPASLSVLYVSSMIGGFAAAKSNRGSALLCGLLTGALLIACLFLFSLFMNASLSAEHSIPLAIGLRGIAIGTSILGAYAGVQNKRKKPKKR